MSVPATDRYGRKLLYRLEGILANYVSGDMPPVSHEVADGVVTMKMWLPGLTPMQADLLVQQMSFAFRRANIFWKQEEAIALYISYKEAG